MCWVWERLGEVGHLDKLLDLSTLWGKNSLEKSWGEAERLRKLGNQYFAKGDFEKAMAKYNQAIFVAPHVKSGSTPTLALSLANRSLVLFHQGRTKAALKDIKEALDNAYPQELQHKLYTRQGRCFAKLGSHLVARRCFEKAQVSCNKHITDKDKLAKALNDIEADIAGLKNCRVVEDEDEEILVPLPQHTSPNPTYPALSNKLEVRHEEGRGRFVVARQTIQPGDLLCSDTALLSLLSPSKYRSNCMHCFRSCATPLPCPSCSSMCFCSSSCRTAAMSSYHKWECKLALQDLYAREEKVKHMDSSFQTLSGSGIFIQLRSMTQKTFRFFISHQQTFLNIINTEKDKQNDTNVKNGVADVGCGDDDCEECCDDGDVYVSNKYKTLYNLEAHTDDEGNIEAHTDDEGNLEAHTDDEGNLEAHTDDEDTESLVWQHVVCAFHLCCLEYTGWMKKLSPMGKKLSEEEVYIASLISHVGKVSQYNSHEVAEMICCRNSLLKTVEVGMAIRPTSCLFNHSCWPNTVRCSSGSSVVTMASTRILPGEEVLEIYTDYFYNQTKTERQKKCAKYKFYCRCKACLENWPLLHCLPGSINTSTFVPGIPNETIGMECSKLQLLQEEADDLLSEGKVKKCVERWKMFDIVASGFLLHPCRSFILVTKNVQICLWILYGSIIFRRGTKIRQGGRPSKQN